MIKISRVFEILGVCILLFQTSNAYSREWSLEAGVDAQAGYNDNIFLTSQPHDGVASLIITPTLAGIIKEQHWQAKLNARIKSNNYSDDSLDSDGRFFDLTGRYSAERNIFSLNINHSLTSNLSTTSDDFGIASKRIDRKSQSIAPQYTRLLTERLVLSLSYTYTDVEYLDAENTGFTPYKSETGSASLSYNLTEKDKLSFSLTAIDYASENDLVTYQLFISRIGIDHKFSETLSTDFLAGVSRQNSTNLNTEEINFFGSTIVKTTEIDAENRGFVLDAGIRQKLETGAIEGRISRDNTTNSFGGLDQVDRFKLNYTEKLSSLWSYTVSARVENISSISASARTTDRDVFYLETTTHYSISRNWNINVSYRYAQRKFNSDTSDNTTPHSNRLHVGLSYNFPSISTF